MKLKKLSVKNLGEKKFKDFYLNLGSSKKNWNSKIKPYLKEVKKSFCFFDIRLSLLLMKQSFNLVSYLGEKKRNPLIKESSKFWDWVYYLSGSKYSEKLILYVDLVEASKRKEKESPLVLSLSGTKGRKGEEKVGYLSPISTEESVRGVDYPVLGNFKSFYGKTLFYSLFGLIFIEKTAESIKKKLASLKKRKRKTKSKRFKRDERMRNLLRRLTRKIKKKLTIKKRKKKLDPFNRLFRRIVINKKRKVKKKRKKMLTRKINKKRMVNEKKKLKSE